MIGIIMATQLEAEPFITGLSLEKRDDSVFDIFSNQHVILILSGIGKTNAAMATTYAICSFSLTCILNPGASGSLGNGPMGHIYHINSVIESDRPVMHRQKNRLYRPNLLKGFEEAVLATQDIPVLDPGERKKLSDKADLIDMEGCAVIHVCRCFKLPCYLFKFISDNQTCHQSSDIIENIHTHREGLFRFVKDRVLPIL